MRRTLAAILEITGRLISAAILSISVGIYKISRIPAHRRALGESEPSRRLARDGWTVVENFLPAETCDRIASDINALYARTKRADEFAMAVDKLPSGTHAHHRCDFDGKVYFDNRTTDFKKIDGEFPYMREILSDRRILSILEPFYGPLDGGRLQCRVYRTENCLETRCLHCDGTDFAQFKVFIYATDVPDETYGPYSYVPGSHKWFFRVAANFFYNAFKRHEHNDCRLVDGRLAHRFIAKKGTLIITNNNGVHRGQPQSDDRLRIVLVGMITAYHSAPHKAMFDAARNVVHAFDAAAHAIVSPGKNDVKPFRQGWIDNRRYWH